MTTPALIPSRSHLRGFTLIELMVSIALVLILVLGINQIFRIATQGIAGGQALSTVGRDNRSAQGVMYDDITHAVMPPSSNGGTYDTAPFFIIRSERVYAYRNRQDHLSDPDGATSSAPTAAQIRTRDIDGDGLTTGFGEDTPPSIYDDRSHRRDTVRFFARGLYSRQTGGTVASSGATPFVSPMASQEAMIYYGHLRLPDYTTSSPTSTATEQFTYRDPGEGTFDNNAQNFYASDWCLGRVANDLVEAASTAGTPTITDRNGDTQVFVARNTATNPWTDDTNLDPLAAASVANSGPAWQHAWSRYDVLGLSMAQAAQIVTQFANRSPVPNVLLWWNVLGDWRYEANPLIVKPNGSTVPATAASVARTAPIFLRGCTQFMVEYTGDFITQNNDPTDIGPVASDPTPGNGRFGDVIRTPDPNQPNNVNLGSIQGDGVPDFVVVWDDANNNGVIDPAEAATMRKVTRWYGMPRDLNGDRKIPGYAAGRTSNQMPDVVPLRDVALTSIHPSNGATGTWAAPYATGATYPTSPIAFERIVAVAPGEIHALPPSNDYAAPATEMSAGAVYICAWGPGTSTLNRPTMLRFTIALDEPSGAMAGEQTFEYVINVP